jgi:hypothetical protein
MLAREGGCEDCSDRNQKQGRSYHDEKRSLEDGEYCHAFEI